MSRASLTAMAGLIVIAIMVSNSMLKSISAASQWSAKIMCSLIENSWRWTFLSSWEPAGDDGGGKSATNHFVPAVFDLFLDFESWSNLFECWRKSSEVLFQGSPTPLASPLWCWYCRLSRLTPLLYQVTTLKTSTRRKQPWHCLQITSIIFSACAGGRRRSPEWFVLVLLSSFSFSGES